MKSVETVVVEPYEERRARSAEQRRASIRAATERLNLTLQRVGPTAPAVAR